MRDDVKDVVASIWADVMATERRIAADEARRNPDRHKLSPIFEGSTRYCYFTTRNGRGSEVRYCYSVERNVAGYFLGWRETVTKRRVKRDEFHASKSKRDIAARCRRYKQEANGKGKS